MNLRTPRTFWLPKAGNRRDECEDAARVVYPHLLGTSGCGTARAAICDGASESAFAREWADALADAFAACPPDVCDLTEDSMRAWLAPARAAWHSGIPWHRIPWHGEAKARAGAFATLLGVRFAARPESSREICWDALAVGDSCLFVVRGDRLWRSFPLGEASQFGNLPGLVCSNPETSSRLWDSVRRCRGDCAAGDWFILASDALACWFLESNAADGRPWQTLLGLDPPAWPAWVEEQRNRKSMRNDDTTLIVIGVG